MKKFTGYGNPAPGSSRVIYGHSDKIQLRVNSDKKIDYVWNGFILYTSPKAPVFPLTVVVTFTPSSTIKDMKWITSATGFAKFPSTPLSNGAIVQGTNMIGVVQSGSTMTKNSTKKSYDAGAISLVPITGPGQGIEWSATAADKALGVGLQTVGHNKGYTMNYMDFGVRLGIAGKQSFGGPAGVCIYETGSPSTSGGACTAIKSVDKSQTWKSTKCKFGPFAADDKFQIRVNSGKKIEYVKNGVVIYTSTKAPFFPLMAQAIFYTPGASIKDFKFITTAGFAK